MLSVRIGKHKTKILFYRIFTSSSVNKMTKTAYLILCHNSGFFFVKISYSVVGCRLYILAVWLIQPGLDYASLKVLLLMYSTRKGKLFQKDMNTWINKKKSEINYIILLSFRAYPAVNNWTLSRSRTIPSRVSFGRGTWLCRFDSIDGKRTTLVVGRGREVCL